MANNRQNQDQEEISLRDIIIFFLKSWKVLVVSIFIGLLCAIGFHAVLPSKYEAIAQIQVMQNNFDKVTLIHSQTPWVIEDPSILITRLKMRSNYENIECEVNQKKITPDQLVDLVRASIVKAGVPLVELKIIMKSKEHAIKCAQIVFENIRRTHDDINNSYVQEAEYLLNKYQLKLKQLESEDVKLEKYESPTIGFLLRRNEIQHISDQIIYLSKFITFNKLNQTRLIAPIYASNLRASSNKNMILLLGILGGLFMGFLLSMRMNLWALKKT